MNWLLVALVVATASLGDILQTMRMKRHGEIRDFRPGALGRTLAAVLRSWHIPASLGLLAVSFFAFVTLLSVAELSFAVPATAAEYVLSTVLARWLLGEQVNWKRWMGAGLVGCGLGLLAL
ncbi:MAG: EamA family transporter [Acidobacteriota bacterium]